MKSPNFFIIGAPKCGTTAMASYLSEHPEIYMTDPKEPHYYNTDIQYGSHKQRESYFSLFSKAKESHKAVGEASVWYLYSKDAVRNILVDFPDAKFVVMLRNPVEMAVSLHKQMLFSGYENIRIFQDAWELQDQRRLGECIPRFCPDSSLLQYGDACALGYQYERLCSQVDKSRLFTIIFDDFKWSPKSVWTELLDFLDVGSDGREEFPVCNSAKKRKSILVKRVNDAYVKARESIGMSGLGTGIFDTLNRWNYKPTSADALPQYLIRDMARHFEGDVYNLSALIDRDLSHWVRQCK